MQVILHRFLFEWEFFILWDWFFSSCNFPAHWQSLCANVRRQLGRMWVGTDFNQIRFPILFCAVSPYTFSRLFVWFMVSAWNLKPVVSPKWNRLIRNRISAAPGMRGRDSGRLQVRNGRFYAVAIWSTDTKLTHWIMEAKNLLTKLPHFYGSLYLLNWAYSACSTTRNSNRSASAVSAANLFVLSSWASRTPRMLLRSFLYNIPSVITFNIKMGTW